MAYPSRHRVVPKYWGSSKYLYGPPDTGFFNKYPKLSPLYIFLNPRTLSTQRFKKIPNVINKSDNKSALSWSKMTL
jgi:hypothetical protein